MTTSNGGDNTNSKAVKERGHGNNLVGIASTWPTPSASEARQGFQRRPEGKASDQNQQSLSTIAVLWATPRSHEVGEYQYSRGDKTKPIQTLTGQAVSHRDREPSTNGETSSPDRRSLNPLFVEWLMGWPPGWTLLSAGPELTGFASSATALSAWRQHMRSALLQLGLPAEAPPAQLALFG
jgi:hypothetical protein